MAGNTNEIENGGTAGTPENPATETAAEGISEVGQAALDEVKAKFTDTTVDESIIGFGDTFCDWRAPLAQVAIVKAAEKAAAKAEEEAEGAEEGEDAASLKEAAKGMHEPTPGKLKKLQTFYSELYPKEEEAGEGEGEGETTTPTTPTETPTEGDQSNATDQSNP